MTCISINMSFKIINKFRVKTADLSVRDSEGGDAMFKLELISRRDGSKFQLCTADKSVKDNWLQTVQFQLDKQLDFVNGQLTVLAVFY